MAAEPRVSVEGLPCDGALALGRQIERRVKAALPPGRAISVAITGTHEGRLHFVFAEGARMLVRTIPVASGDCPGLPKASVLAVRSWLSEAEFELDDPEPLPSPPTPTGTPPDPPAAPPLSRPRLPSRPLLVTALGGVAASNLSDGAVPVLSLGLETKPWRALLLGAAFAYEGGRGGVVDERLSVLPSIGVAFAPGFGLHGDLLLGAWLGRESSEGARFRSGWRLGARLRKAMSDEVGVAALLMVPLPAKHGPDEAASRTWIQVGLSWQPAWGNGQAPDTTVSKRSNVQDTQR